MMRPLLAAALMLLPLAAHAQQGLDPRLASPALQVMQANLAFAEAKLRIQQDDVTALTKRLCEAIPEDKRAGQPECAAKAAEAK